MTMGNMEWIRLAATKGQGSNIQLASAGQHDQTSPQPEPQAADGDTSTVDLIFCVDRYRHALKEWSLNYRISGATDGAWLTTDLDVSLDNGKVEAKGVAVPKADASIQIRMSMDESEPLDSSCAIEPGTAKKLYILVKPELGDPEISGQTARRGTTEIGPTSSAGHENEYHGSARGGVEVGIWSGGVEGGYARTDRQLQTGPSQNRTTDEEETHQRPTRPLIGVEVSVSKSAPTLHASLPADTTEQTA